MKKTYARPQIEVLILHNNNMLLSASLPIDDKKEKEVDSGLAPSFLPEELDE